MVRTKKAWINGLFLITTLAVNTMGALGFINGLSQKDISDKYLTLITPSPFTFSIWSIIYTLLIISLAVMILKKGDSYYERAVDEVSSLFRISCVLNMAWIVAFSSLMIELSVLFIFLFLITLTLICKKLSAIQKGKHFLLPLTFGMYTGWLLIATVVNIAAALVKAKWNGFGILPETWSVIILIAALGIAFVVVLNNKNAVIPIPIAWAYFGIYKFLTASEGYKGVYGSLQATVIIGIVVLLGIFVMQFIRNGFSLVPQK